MTNSGNDDRQGVGHGVPKSGSGTERALERLFEHVSIEAAPARLTRRLRRIPAEHRARSPWWRRLLPTPIGPRHVLVPALAASLLAVGVVLVMPRQPSQAEVLQARHDLAIAFRYIGEAGRIAGEEIQTVLDGGLRHPVKESLSEHIPFTEQFRKEESS